MKKTAIFVISIIILLSLTSCNDRLDNIPTLTALEDKSIEWVNERLDDYTRDDIITVWGEPDGSLSGFWGDIWNIDGSDKQVVVYYDDDGEVDLVKITTV